MASGHKKQQQLDICQLQPKAGQQQQHQQQHHREHQHAFPVRIEVGLHVGVRHHQLVKIGKK